jgi:hypothetical protein
MSGYSTIINRARGQHKTRRINQRMTATNVLMGKTFTDPFGKEPAKILSARFGVFEKDVA